ncbi:hypothetical protein CFD26_109145, partial [Aspergillus turcosus]
MARTRSLAATALKLQFMPPKDWVYPRRKEVHSLQAPQAWLRSSLPAAVASREDAVLNAKKVGFHGKLTATATPGEPKDKQLNAQGQSSALLLQMHGLVAPDFQFQHHCQSSEEGSAPEAPAPAVTATINVTTQDFHLLSAHVAMLGDAPTGCHEYTSECLLSLMAGQTWLSKSGIATITKLREDAKG